MGKDNKAEEMASTGKSSQIAMTKVGTSIVLTPKGSFTYKNCEDLEKLFKDLIHKKNASIVIDCKSLSFLDSKALELLLQMHDELEERGGSLKFFGLNGVCRDILVVTRLINVFHVYQDIQEGLKRES